MTGEVIRPDFETGSIQLTAREALVKLVSLVEPSERVLDTVWGLESEFGSMHKILRATPEVLRARGRISFEMAVILKCWHAIHLDYLTQAIKNNKIGEGIPFIAERCRYDFSEYPVKTLRAFYYASGNYCSESPIYLGTMKELIVHPREIVKNALAYSSDSVFICFGTPKNFANIRSSELDFIDELKSAGNHLDLEISGTHFITNER